MQVTDAVGIVGFVRFIQGWYVVLTTKRRQVGFIGPHEVYTIESWNLFPLKQPVAKAKDVCIHMRLCVYACIWTCTWTCVQRGAGFVYIAPSMPIAHYTGQLSSAVPLVPT